MSAINMTNNMSSAGSALARPMHSPSTDYDILAKAIIIGDSSVGKSSLLYRYSEQDWNPHYIATIGVDFKVMTFERDGKIVKLQIWDTAGQDRFRTIVHTYYRGAHAVLLVFAVDDHESFDNLQEWLGDVNRFATDGVPIVLIGNKADCRAEDVRVSDEEAQALANRVGGVYMKTSARMNEGVDQAFTELLERGLRQSKTIAEKRRAAGERIEPLRLNRAGGPASRKTSSDKCSC